MEVGGGRLVVRCLVSYFSVLFTQRNEGYLWRHLEFSALTRFRLRAG